VVDSRSRFAKILSLVENTGYEVRNLINHGNVVSHYTKLSNKIKKLHDSRRNFSEVCEDPAR
jgi:hypothetical protein